jgi:hypothetical protein
MAPELKDLLDRSVQHPPAEPHHVGDIVHRAQRARRRRRGIAIGAGATAVLAVAALGTVVSGGLPGADHVQPAQTGVVGPVVHLAEASVGVAGADFSVGTTFTNQNLDRGNGRLYQQTDDEGQVLVSQATLRTPGDAMSEYNRFALLDPVTGVTNWLPEPPDAHFSTESAPSGPEVRAIQGSTVVWAGVDQRNRSTVDVYDRDTGAWRSIPHYLDALAPPKVQDAQPERFAVADGRIWFTAGGMTGTGSTDRLWSMPLDGSAKPRSQGVVGDWAIEGTTLAYTETSNRPISKLTVRDLTTGKETSFDPQSGDRCNQLSLALSGERIALGQYCGEHHGIRDDRVQVVTTSGEPVVTIQDSGLELAGLGTDFVVGSSYGEAPRSTGAGTYVYDFGKDRLVRVAEGIGKFSPTNTAGDNALTWSTPVNGHHGMKLWAGTWR